MKYVILSIILINFPQHCYSLSSLKFVYLFMIQKLSWHQRLLLSMGLIFYIPLLILLFLIILLFNFIVSNLKLLKILENLLAIYLKMIKWTVLLLLLALGLVTYLMNFILTLHFFCCNK